MAERFICSSCPVLDIRSLIETVDEITLIIMIVVIGGSLSTHSVRGDLNVTSTHYSKVSPLPSFSIPSRLSIVHGTASDTSSEFNLQIDVQCERRRSSTYSWLLWRFSEEVAKIRRCVFCQGHKRGCPRGPSSICSKNTFFCHMNPRACSGVARQSPQTDKLVDIGWSCRLISLYR